MDGHGGGAYNGWNVIKKPTVKNTRFRVHFLMARNVDWTVRHHRCFLTLILTMGVIAPL